jgi:hypothetical protein
MSAVVEFMKTNRPYNVSPLGFVTATGVAALIGLASLQSANAWTPKRHPRVRQVNARFDNQQDRISQGVKSGELTPRETANLETKEASLKNQEQTMRLENGGSLTKAQQVKLNKEENNLSRQVYDQKHDAQTQTTTPKSEVGARLENQQDRIAQGIKSGELTSGETARLEAREVALRQQIATDRNANGGKLTDAERKQINQELNGLSTRIYKQKHDDQTRL